MKLFKLLAPLFLFISCSSLAPWKSSFEVPKSEVGKGYRALVVTTSQKTLDIIDKETGEVIEVGDKTGVYAAELTEPYYVFSDSAMKVDVASIKGGEIPIESFSLNWFIRTDYDDRYLEDEAFKEKVKNSLKIDDVDFNDYDIIFFAGGWGAAYDLGQSEVLGNKVSSAYKNKKVLAAVCHGPLAFAKAVKENGEPLVKGVRLTAVTNKQVKQLFVDETPLHPEEVMISLGANYEKKERWIEMFANRVVVDKEHRIVTGQNQRGGSETAFRALGLMLKKE